MNELKPRRGSELAAYNPERHRLTDAAIDFGIEEAKRIKDWPTLEKAVDAKIEEQQKFVAWWDVSVDDGGGRPAKTGPRTRTGLSAKAATDLTGLSKQRVSDLGKRLTKPDKYREQLLGAGYHAAMLEVADNFRALGTGNNEWFTPSKYIDLARAVLGDIDLDPATHEQAQSIVGAAKYFTKEHDGLKHEWHGRIWLNPPYAQPLLGQFVGKLCEERRADRVTAAIMLTHNYTDAAWFHQAAGCADAISFTRGRVKFTDPDGTACLPTQGQAFFYFGKDVDRFADVFADVGFVANVIS